MECLWVPIQLLLKYCNAQRGDFFTEHAGEKKPVESGTLHASSAHDHSTPNIIQRTIEHG